MIDTKTDMVKREPTSLNIDPELWREVKIMAINMGITATDFFEDALRDKLAKERLARERFKITGA